MTRFRKIALRKRGCLAFPSSGCSIGSGVSLLRLIHSLTSGSLLYVPHSDIRHQQVREALMTGVTSRLHQQPTTRFLRASPATFQLVQSLLTTSVAVTRNSGCLPLVLPDTFHQIEVGESSPVFVHVGLPVGSDQDRTQVGNAGCVGGHQ